MSLSKTHLLPENTGNTQEEWTPSRHDCKIVDWDVKPQNKLPLYNAMIVVHRNELCYEGFILQGNCSKMPI